MAFLKMIDRCLGYFLRWGSVSLLGMVFTLLSFNVFVRFFPVVKLGWYDEVVELMVAWMVFLGAAALWRENEHFAITFFPESLHGKKTAQWLDILLNLVGMVFIGVFTWYSLTLTLRVSDWTPVINMPKSVLYASMPVSGAIMMIYSLRNILVSCLILGRRQATDSASPDRQPDFS